MLVFVFRLDLEVFARVYCITQWGLIGSEFLVVCAWFGVVEGGGARGRCWCYNLARGFGQVCGQDTLGIG